ncbi:NUDIX hydrolase [Aeromicrobium massiliense]|uniref:NUDIX hydrolase n=1 Tax=Aeromicrobium massiliense TaxID=1464554 RepID=UPI000675C73D|nr:NUDIX hydrolase [Aeromicrobium massiliense]
MSDDLRDGELRLVPTSGNDDVTGFAIEVEGQRVGTVAVLREGPGVGSLRWNASDPSLAARGLRLAVAHALDGLGLDRVQADVADGDSTALRAATLAGLRREGVSRRPEGTADRIVLGRVSGDPSPTTRDGFIAMLNAGLPTKRVIAQGLLRDETGRVLLCELTYKREWDLPGGVVEPLEPPAEGLVRELQEELGVTVEVQGLVTVNWLPAWRGWDDACVFVFDLGVADAALVETFRLQPSEIKAVHWADEATVAERGTSATNELLSAWRAGDLPAYREAPKAAE